MLPGEPTPAPYPAKPLTAYSTASLPRAPHFRPPSMHSLQDTQTHSDLAPATAWLKDAREVLSFPVPTEKPFKEGLNSRRMSGNTRDMFTNGPKSFLPAVLPQGHLCSPGYPQLVIDPCSQSTWPRAMLHVSPEWSSFEVRKVGVARAGYLGKASVT